LWPFGPFPFGIPDGILSPGGRWDGRPLEEPTGGGDYEISIFIVLLLGKASSTFSGARPPDSSRLESPSWAMLVDLSPSVHQEERFGPPNLALPPPSC